MEISKNNISWIETWETNKSHNIEVGFDNHKLLKGFISNNVYPTLNNVPYKEFFSNLKKQIPKLYIEDEIIYAELDCFIDNEPYKIQFDYAKDCWIIKDKDDTIIEKR